jgi:hypothetical protein
MSFAVSQPRCAHIAEPAKNSPRDGSNAKNLKFENG